MFLQFVCIHVMCVVLQFLPEGHILRRKVYENATDFDDAKLRASFFKTMDTILQIVRI